MAVSVSYVSAGNSILASQLNALTAETDDVLDCLFAGKSPLIYFGGDGVLPMGHVVAFGDSGNWKIIPLIASLFGLAEYDHSVFTTAAAALTVASFDTPNEVANVNEEDPWPLDGSLQAHTVDDSGTTYYFRQLKSSGTVQGYRERHLRLDTVDVIMEGMTGDLTWDSDWDKYHFIRFHNLDLTTVTVTMPGAVDIEVPPLGIQAVRRAYKANTYDTTYRYLWKAESGDLLFFDGIRSNNVASIQCFLDILNNAAGGLETWTGSAFTALFLKASELWDGSSLLPASLIGSTPAYQLRYHLGRIVSWEDAAGTPDPHDFTPTWSSLAAGTNGVKWDTSTLTLSADTGATAPVDACGIGSNLLPIMPKTLPHDASWAVPAIDAIGVELTPTTLSSRWWNGSSWVDVDVDYDHASSAVAFSSSGSGDDTLTTIAALTSSHSDEQLDTPTVTWVSDGWKVVGCGTQTIPFSNGVFPPDNRLGYCTFGRDDATEHFGADIMGSLRGDWDGTGRQHGRKLCDHVGFTDVFDVVFQEGHPDLTGNYELADGEDFVESRQTNDESVVFRDDHVSSTATTSTRGILVYPLADSAEEIAANSGDGSWYTTHRTRLLAGTATVDEREKLIRYPVLGRHYNAVAQRLNAIMSIRPCTLDEVIYYGRFALEDRTWTVAAYPPDYYCAVQASGSHAASLGLTVTGTGSEAHLTLATAAAWADTLGVRFFTRRFSSMRRMSGGVPIRTRLTTALYRLHLGSTVWVGRCVEDSSGSSPPVYLTPDAATSLPESANYEEIVDVEHAEELGPTLPTGWEWSGDSLLMTIPRPMVNWIDDPLADTEDNSVVDVYPAESQPAAVWPAEDYDGTLLDSPTIAGMYGITPTPDERTTWQIRLANRFYIVRS